MIYYPDEDSYLLRDCLLKHKDEIKNKEVIEIGTGTGFIAYSLANITKKIYAFDINKKAIRYALKHNNHKNIKYFIGDKLRWFNFSNTFIIIFNPPYLPADDLPDKQKIDYALYGGEQGYEFTESIIKELKKNRYHTTLFFILSSLSRPQKIEKYGLKKVECKKLSFEEICCYKLTI